jgi:Tol biopolymer transport system component
MMWWKTLLKVFILVSAVAFVAVFGLRGCMTQHTRPFGYQDISFSFAPRGDRLVFNAEGNGGRDLFMLDLIRLQVTAVTDTTDYETCPAFSPDGRSIVYSAGRRGDRADHLFIQDLNTHQVKQLTSEDANDCASIFSPDGSHILFTRDMHYNWGGLATSWSAGGSVWSINRDGTGLRRVLPSNIFAISPQLSSDGKTLLWWDTQGVWIARADGSGTPRLIVREGRDAVFSPGGNKIAFTQGQYSPDLRIYLIPATGGQPTLLTQTSGGCFHPQYSPDGKTVFFMEENWPNGGSGSPECSLWCIGTDGGHLQKLAGGPLFNTPMSSANFKH